MSWWGTQEVADGPSAKGNNVRADFNVLQQLGAGTYGTVYKGSRKSDGLEVAVKERPKRRIRNLRTVRDEVKIMLMLDHPNVLK